jgi:hypothetical protein
MSSKNKIMSSTGVKGMLGATPAVTPAGSQKTNETKASDSNFYFVVRNPDISASTLISGNLEVTGNVQVDQNLAVTGKTTSTGTISANGGISVADIIPGTGTVGLSMNHLTLQLGDPGGASSGSSVYYDGTNNITVLNGGASSSVWLSTNNNADTVKLDISTNTLISSVPISAPSTAISGAVGCGSVAAGGSITGTSVTVTGGAITGGSFVQNAQVAGVGSILNASPTIASSGYTFIGSALLGPSTPFAPFRFVQVFFTSGRVNTGGPFTDMWVYMTNKDMSGNESLIPTEAVAKWYFNGIGSAGQPFPLSHTVVPYFGGAYPYYESGAIAPDFYFYATSVQGVGIFFSDNGAGGYQYPQMNMAGYL